MSWVKGRVTDRRDWDEGLCSLFVDAPLGSFRPGQFINVGLSLGGQRVRRAYSPASAPGAPLELYLVRVPGGALSPHLYRLQIGDELDVDTEAHGFFVLSELPRARDLWLLATGTGLGPYLAMLRDGAILDSFERVTLVHGVRRAAQLGYREELVALERSSSMKFRYLAATSRDESAQALHGRITSLYRSGELERAAACPLAPQVAHVMLCGNPDMISEMMTHLALKGLKKHRRREPGHITTEKYW
jgi:ferredoxin--NADP+ reductase